MAKKEKQLLNATRDQRGVNLYKSCSKEIKTSGLNAPKFFLFKWSAALFLLAILLLPQPALGQMNKMDLIRVLKGKDSQVDSVLSNPSKYNFQLIYTSIERLTRKKPKLYTYNFNTEKFYFNPASMMKLPLALVALEKLSRLKSLGVSIDDSVTVTPSNCTGDVAAYLRTFKRPTIRLILKDMIVVSNNSAYNFFYDICGLDDFNSRMKELGLKKIVLKNRFASCTPEQDLVTNPIHLFDPTTGDSTYTFPSRKSVKQWLINSNWPHELGTSHYEGGALVNGPKSFALMNYAALSDLHKLLTWLIFPELQQGKYKIALDPEYRNELLRVMGMFPAESKEPLWDKEIWTNNRMKYLMPGDADDVRVFNKVGQAYGSLSDCSYFIDTVNNVEYFLSAAIHTDSDGIAADGNYDYNFSFQVLRKIGRIFYEEALKHPKSKKLLLPVKGNIAD